MEADWEAGDSAEEGSAAVEGSAGEDWAEEGSAEAG